MPAGGPPSTSGTPVPATPGGPAAMGERQVVGTVRAPLAAVRIQSESGDDREVDLAQAIVYLIRQDDTLLARDGQVVFALTDAKGRFAFHGVPDEPLLVAAVLPGNRRLAGLVRPSEGENRLDIDLATTYVAAYLRDRMRAAGKTLGAYPRETLAKLGGLATLTRRHLAGTPLVRADLAIDASPGLARTYGVLVASRHQELSAAWADLLGRHSPAIETLARPALPGGEIRSVAVAPDATGSIFFGETGDLTARLAVRPPGGGAIAPESAGTTLLLGSRENKQLGLPAALGFDPSGALLLGDGFSGFVRRFKPGSIKTTDIDLVPVEGDWTTPSGEIPAIPGKAFREAHPKALDISPRSVAFGPDGTVFLADARNHRVLAIAKSGAVKRIAGLPPAPDYDSNGLAGFSGDGGPAAQAALAAPNGVTWRPEGASGSLYVADTDNHRIRRIDLASGIISTVAGSGAGFVRSAPPPGDFGGDGGPATAARLKYPFKAVFLPDGAMLVADSGNQRIRAVEADGTIRTLAGGEPTRSGATAADGPADETVLGEPFDLAVDAAGDVLVAARDKGLRKLWLRFGR